MCVAIKSHEVLAFVGVQKCRSLENTDYETEMPQLNV